MFSQYFWGLWSTPTHDSHVLGEGLVDSKLFGKDDGFEVMSCMARTSFTRFVFAICNCTAAARAVLQFYHLKLCITSIVVVCCCIVVVVVVVV